MATREIAVKKYVVKLSLDERERLETMIHNGKHPAQRLTKARILLKADAGEAGEGWSDSQIANSPGEQPGDHRPHPPATCGGRVRCRVDPQALAGVGPTAHL